MWFIGIYLEPCHLKQILPVLWSKQLCYDTNQLDNTRLLSYYWSLKNILHWDIENQSSVHKRWIYILMPLSLHAMYVWGAYVQAGKVWDWNRCTTRWLYISHGKRPTCQRQCGQLSYSMATRINTQRCQRMCGISTDVWNDGLWSSNIYLRLIINFDKILSNLVIITVPAVALAPKGARASAGTVINVHVYGCHIYW